MSRDPYCQASRAGACAGEGSLWYTKQERLRAVSSVVRALASHARGPRFKSSTAHQRAISFQPLAPNGGLTAGRLMTECAEVAERQTRYVQGVVPARACGFKSLLRHHNIDNESIDWRVRQSIWSVDILADIVPDQALSSRSRRRDRRCGHDGDKVSACLRSTFLAHKPNEGGDE